MKESITHGHEEKHDKIKIMKVVFCLSMPEHIYKYIYIYILLLLSRDYCVPCDETDRCSLDYVSDGKNKKAARHVQVSSCSPKFICSHCGGMILLVKVCHKQHDQQEENCDLLILNPRTYIPYYRHSRMGEFQLK